MFLKFILKIRREWEITSFAIALCILAAYLASWYLGFGHDASRNIGRKRTHTRRSILNYASAFTFLEQPGTALLGPGINPFDIPGPTGSENVVVTPKPERPTRPKPGFDPKPEPAPKPRPRHAMEYCGTMTTPGGTEMALLRNKKSKRAKYVTANQEFEGLRVIEFTPEQIRLELPSGEDRTIQFGETVRYTEP